MKANRLTRALAELARRRILRPVSRRRPDFVIGPPADPYMERWWVIPRNRWLNIYLHRIRHDDDDRALHDHPWANVTLVLAGGYVEHTPQGKFRREVGDLVFRRATTLHRLELLPELRRHGREIYGRQKTWSLFLTGPVVRTWGFACPQGWVPWQRFVEPERPGEVGRGCGEGES